MYYILLWLNKYQPHFKNSIQLIILEKSKGLSKSLFKNGEQIRDRNYLVKNVVDSKKETFIS
jgi:hypothetical protein